MLAPLELFSCPNCRAALFSAPGALECRSCSQTYAELGGVWCLVPHPDFWRTLWLSRVADFRELVQRHIARLNAKLAEHALLAATERRLVSLRQGLLAQAEAITTHLAPLGLPPTGPLRSAFAAAGHLPVVKCYENLFRDWSWGAAEAREALELVQAMAPAELGTCAVYGAGASRLAVDVHTSLRPQRTIALDINPFPLLVAARLTRGDEVTLPEFPVGPDSAQNVVVTQTLRCPSLVDERFSFAFGDALRPPFAVESLDSVLTSWVIDALDADFADTAAAIGNVLRLGGTWLNTGPLRFDRGLTEAYSIEEVQQIGKDAGFELVRTFQSCVDYFNSPHSGSRRRENVFCFALRKVARAPAREPVSIHPAWLVDAKKPIPLTATTALLRKSSVLRHGVLSLVDGKRSLTDIAGALGEQWSMQPESLLDPLRVFFSNQGIAQ